MKTKIILIIIFIVLSVPIAFYSWFTHNLSYKGHFSIPYIKFVIKSKETQSNIIFALKKVHAISSINAFNIYLNFENPLFTFKPGIYRIYNGENVNALIEIFNKGSFYRELLIPSGLRISQQANVIRNELSTSNKYYKFSTSQFRNIAHTDLSDFHYQFLTYLPKGSTLEGFLYPGLYTVPLNADAKYIIDKELLSFENNIFEKFKGFLLTSSDKLSFYQNIIIASIVRRETLYNSDKPIVANIFIRRFLSGIPLGSDATVQYMLGFDTKEQKWWRTNITPSEISINSPYNTRINKGLPPTPICSPGFNSIKATLFSTPNNYWYFLSGPKGHLHYAITSKGHINNIKKYLG
ncbi:endolytic transglycosylase MltG [Patescibacteria group bacterium]|nr:endolytic transglycosylase MltG [Patescibacteria group bacterium]